MADHAAPLDYEKLLYARSESALKVHGIISIVFGGIGTLAGIFFTLLFIAGNYVDASFDSASSPAGLFLVSALLFVFWTVPHVYLIISGCYLVREPVPQVAKTLIIINLVVGVFWNLVLLIYAIVNLTQFMDYERGYHLHKKKR